MVLAREVVEYFRYLANNRIGIDNDGMFGWQCADEPAYVASHYFGKSLYGNAIDLLDSARAAGFEVVMEGPGVYAKAGWAFVMEVPGSPYGHTGIVIEDSDGYTLKTIEQNVDGNPDYLEVGGPARYVTRSYNNIVGFIAFPYEEEYEKELTSDGWHEDYGKWYYYEEDGNLARNKWLKIENQWYRFKDDASIYINDWYLDEYDRWFYLDEDGAMCFGWRKIDNKWYYFDDSGVMKTGWLQYYNKWYYLETDNQGNRVSKEFREIDGKWYAFNENGEMMESTSISVDDQGQVIL